MFLICKDEGESKLFDVLQEKSSRNEYNIILRQLIYFYLRNLEMKVELDSDSEDSEQS